MKQYLNNKYADTTCRLCGAKQDWSKDWEILNKEEFNLHFICGSIATHNINIKSITYKKECNGKI